jgi:uncharacterized protein (TIGR02246 family)
VTSQAPAASTGLAAFRPAARPVRASAARLLTRAGVVEDPAYYGPFTKAQEKAVLTVPQLIQAAWAANDADAFADVFTGNGSLLMREDQLTSRGEIHTYMTAGFRNEYRGARVTGWPLHVRFLRPDAAVVVTQGGIILAGETAVAPEREIRATWVIVAGHGRWLLLSHHSSPIGQARPGPARPGSAQLGPAQLGPVQQ